MNTRHATNATPVSAHTAAFTPAAMSGPVMVGVDSREHSQVAARQGVRLADARHVPLHLVTAVRCDLVGPINKGTDEWFFDSFDIARQMLVALGQRLSPAAGFTTAVVSGRPLVALAGECGRVSASAVVLGAHQEPGVPNPGQPEPSGLARSLCRRVSCDVLVAADPARMTSVGVDGIELSDVDPGCIQLVGPARHHVIAPLRSKVAHHRWLF